MTATISKKILSTLNKLNRATASEIAEVCGFSRRSVTQVLERFEDYDLAHVCDWQPMKSGRPVRVYRFGKGENVPRKAAEKYQAERTVHRDDFRHVIKTQFPKVNRCDVAASWMRNEP